MVRVNQSSSIYLLAIPVQPGSPVDLPKRKLIFHPFSGSMLNFRGVFFSLVSEPESSSAQ